MSLKQVSSKGGRLFSESEPGNLNSNLVSASNGHVAVEGLNEISTQELLKTPSQLPTKTDDGLTQKMFDALEESEGKFALL